MVKQNRQIVLFGYQLLLSSHSAPKHWVIRSMYLEEISIII